MSNGSQEIARVRRARCILERIRDRLRRPSLDSLTSSAADLNQAVECLRQLDVSLRSPIWQGLTRQKIEAEVVELRYTVKSVEELLKNAGKFYAGLGRLLAPDEAPSNYTAAGATGRSLRIREGNMVLHG